MLWHGGISFGGVIAFIFGDLIIPPILNIYRKYYGGRMAIFLGITFYVVMVAAALLVEGLFTAFRLVPQGVRHGLGEQSIHLNYTTVLNVLFGFLALALFTIFVRTGGTKMMRDM